MTNISSGRSLVKKQILDSISNQTNTIVFSFSGNGGRFFLKKIIDSSSQKITVISSKKDTPSSVNLIEVKSSDFSKDLSLINFCFNKATPDQKFIIYSDNPYLFLSLDQKSHPFLNHIYKKIYIPVRNPDETKDFIVELDKDLIGQFTKIHLLSGGISRLIKYLCLNSNLLSLSPNQILDQDSDIKKILDTIARNIYQLKKNQLLNFNLTDTKEGPTSSLLDCYLSINQHLFINININPDFSFAEDHQLSKSIFTKSEADIICYLIENQIINRDTLAKLKWGKLSYENYSDQAINQTISRINSKLEKHIIQSIPKLGYKLIKKND